MSHNPQHGFCAAQKMQEYLKKGLACCQDKGWL